MSGGQIAVLVIGGVALAESTWGILSPSTLREALRRAGAEAPGRSPGLAVLFAGLAGGLWLLMSPARTAVDWALLFASWLLAGGALVNLRERAFARLVAVLILDRPLWAIRLFYLGEFAVACILVAIGAGAG